MPKAIDLYQKILKQFPENREIAAKAQLHIGLCYEKLGLKEAQKAYREVIDNYPEFQREVAIAKERIAMLSKVMKKVSHKPTFRKIQIPTKLADGELPVFSKERLRVLKNIDRSMIISYKVCGE